MESELVYVYLLPLIQMVLNFEVVPLVKACKEYIVIIVLVLYCSYMSKLPYDMLGWSLPRFEFIYRLLRLALPSTFEWWIGFLGLSTHQANIRVYIDTAVVVLISYASLLHINLNYVWFAIFPFITLAFIIALCNEELCGESRSQQRSSGASEANLSSTGTSAAKDAKKTKSRLEVKAISVVPYGVLRVMGQFHYAADKYAISQFLLFLSSTLGSLTLMMARLVPTGVTPDLAPASELLHKASLVALLVTVHTVAAELLGEDVVMFCLPEFVPVLLWFSVHVDRGSSIITVDKIKRHKTGLVALGAVVAAAFAYLAASMDESGLSRCTKTLVSCVVSGLLIYYVVFMLCQWPGQASTATTTSLKEAVELLQFWANVLLIAAAALLVLVSLAAVRLGLHEPMVATLAKFFDDYADTFLLLIDNLWLRAQTN